MRTGRVEPCPISSDFRICIRVDLGNGILTRISDPHDREGFRDFVNLQLIVVRGVMIDVLQEPFVEVRIQGVCLVLSRNIESGCYSHESGDARQERCGGRGAMLGSY